jgi:hypothetical protein
MVPVAAPHLPAPRGPEWDRVTRLGKLLQVAEETRVIVIPPGVHDHYAEALVAKGERRAPPPMRTVRRELTLLREQTVWTLRVMGHSQASIAHFLGVSQPFIAKVLRRVERRAVASMNDDVRAVKLRLAAQLEYVHDVSMRAWQKSRESLEESTCTTTGGRYDPLGHGTALRRTGMRRGPGDPRFLAVALKSLAGQCKLWGLGLGGKGGDDLPLIEATRTDTLRIRGACPRCAVGSSTDQGRRSGAGRDAGGGGSDRDGRPRGRDATAGVLISGGD